MEFIEQYPEFSKLSINCGRLDTYVKVKTISMGSGGSDNVVILGQLKYNKKMIAIKIVPFTKKLPFMIERNPKDQNEIEFYKLFTKNIILDKISPHIVGMYKYRHCPDITNILPNTCLTTEESLFKHENEKNLFLCRLYKMLFDKKISKQFDILLLEYCPVSLSDKLFGVSKFPVRKLLLFLDRLLFQIIFTLAQLYKIYPLFQHGDLFIRNILGIDIDYYDDTDFIEYVYDDYKFYFPANGYYAKITDFGESRLNNIIINDLHARPGTSSMDHVSDIFNFLHDIYDGQHLGADSLNTLIKNKSKKNIVRNYFKKFIDVNYIDRFNKNNRFTFDSIWNIADYPKIRKALKIREPKDYFRLFVNEYSFLPPHSNIIESFGYPH